MNVILEARTIEDAPFDGNLYVRKDGAWVLSSGDGVDRTETTLAVDAERKLTLGSGASYSVTIDGEAVTLVLAPPPVGSVRNTVLRVGIVNGGSLALPARGYRRFGDAGPYTSDVRLAVRQYADGSLPDIYVLPPHETLPNVVRGTIFTDAIGLPSGASADGGALIAGAVLSGSTHLGPRPCILVALTQGDDRGQYFKLSVDESHAHAEDYYGRLDIRLNGTVISKVTINPPTGTPNFLLIDYGAGIVRWNGAQFYTFTPADITNVGANDLEIGTGFSTVHYVEISSEGNLTNAEHQTWEADANYAAGVML